MMRIIALFGLLLVSTGLLAQLANRDIYETDVNMYGTGALLLPKGTSAQRPSSAVEGQIRYNTTIGNIEIYRSGVWTLPLGASTFSDSDFRVYDNGDDTKVIALEASGITTGTTRTLTVQDGDGTIATLEADNAFTGANTFSDNITMSGTGHIKVPSGTTAERPGSPIAGMFRYNTTLGAHEAYNGTAWIGFEASTKVDGAGTVVDNTVTRFDGTTGLAVQGSGVTIDDSNNIVTPGNFTAANATITGATTLATSLTGPLKASSGVVSASDIDLTSEVTGILPIANGGTGSATQNFVDLTTAQSVAGVKTFSDLPVFSSGIDVNGTSDFSNLATFSQYVAISTTNGSRPCPVMTAAQRDAIATPSEGDCVVNSDDNQVYFYLNSVWSLTGGGGEGGINYVSNNDIENDATGYSVFDDGAYPPTDGTGGTTSVTIARSTTSATYTPLREDGNLLFTKTSGADYTGEGFSYDITIDKGWQGNRLRGNVWILANDTDCVNDALRIDVYDVTNAALIDVTSGDRIKCADGPYAHNFYFSAANNSTSYRVIFTYNNSDTNEVLYYFDQVAVSPVNPDIVRLDNITDWESYSCTVNNFTVGNGTVTCFYKEVGDSISVSVSIVLGSTSAVTGSLSVDYPSGMTADSAKFGSLQSNTAVTLADSDTPANREVGTVRISTSNMLVLTFENAALSSTAPFTWATSDRISFTAYDIPIEGKSSGLTAVTQATELNANTANELSAGISSTFVVETQNYDGFISGNCTNPATGRVVCPVTPGVFTQLPVCTLVQNNGIGNAAFSGTFVETNSTITSLEFSFSDQSGVGFNPNAGFGFICSKQGADVNKSQVIAGVFENINSSQTPVVEAAGNGNTVLTDGVTPIDFVESIDSDGLWSSNNTFTVPETGNYTFTGSINLSSTLLRFFSLYRDTTGIGSSYTHFKSISSSISSNIFDIKGTFRLNKGDLIQVRINNGGGTLSNNSVYHHLHISRDSDTESIIKNLNDNNNLECQTKYLTADINSSTNPISNLTFNNLTVGKKYKVVSFARASFSVASSFVLESINGTRRCNNIISGASGSTPSNTSLCLFTASATTLTHATNAGASTILSGNGTIDETHVTLCELPDNTILNSTKWN